MIKIVRKQLGLILLCMALMVEMQAQNELPFSCALDNFVEIARKKDSNFDAKMMHQEKLRDQWKALSRSTQSSNYVIPVVVHVVYFNAADSVTVPQAVSQIAVLNTDYMRLNADTIKTPAAFVPICANPHIQFCLAQTDPMGNPTNGVTYTKTPKSSFPLVYGDTTIWYTSLGGFDGWDPTRYLNIWVADISPAGGVGFWPGAVFAGHREGVVINPTFFGTMGTAVAPYNLGRTATHEIGHYLDLHHLWGDGNNNSSCTATDYCNDTPTQVTASQNCPAFPKTDACTSASPGLAFMNFMDYPRDSCRNMFTTDQVARMVACLNGPRASLFNSPACTLASGVQQAGYFHFLKVFPNPATQVLNIRGISGLYAVKMYDVIGQVVLAAEKQNDSSLDINDLSTGIYTLMIEQSGTKKCLKVVVQN
jgi:hypothetical protein